MQLWQAQNQTCGHSYSWKVLTFEASSKTWSKATRRIRHGRAHSGVPLPRLTSSLSYAAAYTNESIPASIISPLWIGNLQAMDFPSPIATQPPSPTLPFCRAILSVTSLHHIPTVATGRSISETARTAPDSYHVLANEYARVTHPRLRQHGSPVNYLEYSRPEDV